MAKKIYQTSAPVEYSATDNDFVYKAEDVKVFKEYNNDIIIREVI